VMQDMLSELDDSLYEFNNAAVSTHLDSSIFDSYHARDSYSDIASSLGELSEDHWANIVDEIDQIDIRVPRAAQRKQKRYTNNTSRSSLLSKSKSLDELKMRRNSIYSTDASIDTNPVRSSLSYSNSTIYCSYYLDRVSKSEVSIILVDEAQVPSDEAVQEIETQPSLQRWSFIVL
jgi:hypothetical protein